MITHRNVWGRCVRSSRTLATKYVPARYASSKEYTSVDVLNTPMCETWYVVTRKPRTWSNASPTTKAKDSSGVQKAKSTGMPSWRNTNSSARLMLSDGAPTLYSARTEAIAAPTRTMQYKDST